MRAPALSPALSTVLNFLLLIGLTPTSMATEYVIDKAHSHITFKIRHIVTKVPGRFKEFNGVLRYDGKNPKTWGVEASIDASSIDTENEERDTHLRNHDFFNVPKYPFITFKSTQVKMLGNGKAKVSGNLNMHGVVKEVTLDVEFSGEGVDLWGAQLIGFTAQGKLNRKDFGIIWNKRIDRGGLLLGDEVDIVMDIQAKKKVANKTSN